MNRTAALALAIVSLGAAFGHAAQAAIASSASTIAAPDKPAEIPFSTSFDLDSKSVGRPFHITVYTPQAPAPPEGFAVIYHADGFLFPATALAAILEQYDGGRPAIVVGVNWATQDPKLGMQYRNKDLTPVTDPAKVVTPPGAPAPKAEDYGGAEAFYRFIADELKPAIASRYKINPKDQILYGHSFGGLFALDVLFRHPEAFNTYLIASPSIFWSGKAVLNGEAGFAARVEAGEISPRILLMAGGEEARGPKTLRPGMTAESAEKFARDAAMVANVEALAGRLSALHGKPPYEVAVHVFEDDDHLNVMLPSIQRGFRFALTH